ncbi:MAG: hypothetical protein RLZ25_1847 [Pseudomonadota bacterium]|jgi:hypothetical protein
MTATAVAQIRKPVTTKKAVTKSRRPTPGAMAVGTGLAFASIILLPAVAAHVGISATLTSALRIALMRASSRVVAGSNEGGDSIPAYLSCH